MANFWTLSDGTRPDFKPDYDSGAELIPAGTELVALIEQAQWDGKDGDEWVSLRWKIASPQQYKGRVIFQKIKVFGTSSDKDRAATVDRAKRMLAAIDVNSGGGLESLTEPPTGEQLAKNLGGKLMAIKVMVWKGEFNGQEKSGNFVSAVSKPPALQSAQPSRPALSRPTPPKAQPKQDADDDIPF